ncbi:hypothetical protein FOCC_FOCC003268 [Frankliniella occidentalis]|uniref:Suppressor of cytokine signaling 6 n=1 Tax=Frankliniella occidentalis TaxID=133901 RepID=A0A6J1SN51_FRAOC|nr:suppressor of cytokine signaling 6 [Frankliniella occidentalis]XP_052120540.1 suppressor of cytokine signaling 6 [Frankliniella occidentalis]KAE8750144.1 hypothetical protein FOCC_FOCC003268 [Frankliniella occidentalis]
MAFKIGMCKFSKLHLGDFKSFIQRRTAMEPEDSEDGEKTGIFNNIKRRFRRRFSLIRSRRCKMTKSNTFNASSHGGRSSLASYESSTDDTPETAVENDSNEKNQSLSVHLVELSRYEWYWGPITREDAEKQLANQPEGSFLVRDSSNDHFLLSVSFRCSGRTFHSRISHSAGKFSFYSAEKNGFNSIPELVQHSINSSQSNVFCYSRPRSPGHPSFPVRLAKPVSRITHVRSLQYLCRFVIRQHIRRDQIRDLPLPPRICDYIEQSQF